MLVIFDIDGTLTRSNAVDSEVYAATFLSVFGQPLPSTNWSDYTEVTDQGIALEAVARLGANRDCLPAFKQAFVSALNERLQRDPVQPVPGARLVLKRLKQDGYHVALATGAWAESAWIKLTSARVDTTDCWLVGSDELVERRAIIKAARHRAVAQERAVYVGDGPWDVLATQALGLPFVGIDAEQSGQLSALGINPVLSGYEDYAGLVAALGQAQVPRLSA